MSDESDEIKIIKTIEISSAESLGEVVLTYLM